MTPQPPPSEENSIMAGFIRALGTNINISDITLSTLINLYAHPTENLSNSSLYNRAAQFATDYSFVAPNRLFLKSASAPERSQYVPAQESRACEAT
ncbi:hypothetical protein R3P38DRAFT_2948793 [Favolaschia claudopus]|uniref:Uncharacterized protein n=1 Tax=Favolaschia claudopus TaxID=2862362 RepID=A0AAW0BHK4_9AGAR